MLKALMLRKKIDSKKAQLEALRAKDQEFETRESELEACIEEASTDEERETVDAEIAKFDEDKAANEAEKTQLESEIADLEQELEEVERSRPAPEKKERKREENVAMNTRTKFFGMTTQERDNFFARDDVKEFLQRTRELAKAERSVTGAELTIPQVVLGLMRENIASYSKLYKHVNAGQVSGKARQNVMGVIPEAIWTEMCAKINEINLSFGSVEADGYKVSGFVAICNAVLEDSDVNMGQAIIEALLKAIGMALDKAIIYGTGTKMPMGILTRLVQTADPKSDKVNVEWKDLHASNVISVTGKTDLAMFKSVIEASGAAKGTYSAGGKFWAMNETTYTKLLANALSINAAGAVVSGMNKTMPVIGGPVETLNFMPDGVIVGGYGDLYMLIERAGATVSKSEHARFTDDQTVFKGVARYDGVPVIAEGFVAIGLDVTPKASDVTFTADTANTQAAS